jgi:hypothetical protein
MLGIVSWRLAAALAANRFVTRWKTAVALGLWGRRPQFRAESCDPDVTLLDNMFFESLETTRTPKKAAIAPVFCFTRW